MYVNLLTTSSHPVLATVGPDIPATKSDLVEANNVVIALETREVNDEESSRERICVSPTPFDDDICRTGAMTAI